MKLQQFLHLDMTTQGYVYSFQTLSSWNSSKNKSQIYTWRKKVTKKVELALKYTLWHYDNEVHLVDKLPKTRSFCHEVGTEITNDLIDVQCTMYNEMLFIKFVKNNVNNENDNLN